MYPWRRILIPTDFSTASEWAFDDAIRIAGSTGAELLILHIRLTQTAHPDELRFPAGDAVYEYAEKQELEMLRERVRRANASVARHEGAEVHVLIVCSEADRPAAESRVSDVARKLFANLPTKPMVIGGDDVEKEIVRYATEADADVVFVNAQKEIGEVKRDII